MVTVASGKSSSLRILPLHQLPPLLLLTMAPSPHLINHPSIPPPSEQEQELPLRHRDSHQVVLPLLRQLRRSGKEIPSRRSVRLHPRSCPRRSYMPRHSFLRRSYGIRKPISSLRRYGLRIPHLARSFPNV